MDRHLHRPAAVRRHRRPAHLRRPHHHHRHRLLPAAHRRGPPPRRPDHKPREVTAMLISQPGSDYQLTRITLDAGRARDITCLLTDIHGLLSELRSGSSGPDITELIQACLRECDSLYTPQTLIGALDEVITTLTR